ncbi:MAG TPA: hypothetical protein VF574_14395 [Allosphingosinicella sp.]|jgi:hypothetical protein
MRLWHFLVLAAGAGAPAQADITATYLNDERESGFEMKVQIAANGDLRADDPDLPGRYMIRRGGRVYFVEQDPRGKVVEDFVDVVAVIDEELSKLDPRVCDRLQASNSRSKLVSRGPVTIAGRSGEAFGPEGREGSPAQIVISRDPALVPLGTAMAAQFRMSLALMGRCAPDVPMYAQMQALLESGAPLIFGPVRLGSVETKAIDPARFALPAEPATREEIRARLFGEAGPAAAPSVRN